MFWFLGTLLWVGLAVLEMMQGVLRAKFLAPRVGDLRSRQIGVMTGSCIILLYTNLVYPWLPVTSEKDSWFLGGLWFLLMFVFEFAVGHFVFRFPWKWLIQDFNLRKGRLLALGMLVLFAAPWLVCRYRGRF